MKVLLEHLLIAATGLARDGSVTVLHLVEHTGGALTKAAVVKSLEQTVKHHLRLSLDGQRIAVSPKGNKILRRIIAVEVRVAAQCERFHRRFSADLVGDHLIKGLPLLQAALARAAGHEGDRHILMATIGALVGVDIAEDDDVPLILLQRL